MQTECFRDMDAKVLHNVSEASPQCKDDSVLFKLLRSTELAFTHHTCSMFMKNAG